MFVLSVDQRQELSDPLSKALRVENLAVCGFQEASELESCTEREISARLTSSSVPTELRG